MLMLYCRHVFSWFFEGGELGSGDLYNLRVVLFYLANPKLSTRCCDLILAWRLWAGLERSLHGPPLDLLRLFANCRCNFQSCSQGCFLVSLFTVTISLGMPTNSMYGVHRWNSCAHFFHVSHFPHAFRVSKPISKHTNSQIPQCRSGHVVTF